MFFKEKKRNIVSIVSSLFVVIAIMIFAPYGTTNPKEVGFFLSIVSGLAISLGTDFLLSKYQRRQ